LFNGLWGKPHVFKQVVFRLNTLPIHHGLALISNQLSFSLFLKAAKSSQGWDMDPKAIAKQQE